MNVAGLNQPTSSTDTYLLVPILLLFGLLIIAVLRAPTLISSAGIGSAIIVAAPLILATYALTIVAMAGRVGVDLSIGPLLGFINVGMIQLFAANIITSAFDFFVYAIAVGVLYQLAMGLIIVFVRVQPIIVALGGFLALVGLNLVILPRPGGVVPDWLSPWGLGETIFSPVLAILVLATAFWFLLTRTAFYGHLRLMGSDERTAYSSGVRIGIVRLGAHAIAGVYSALAAITFTALIGSGDPTQGTTYTLMAITALVLGGTSLAGGRGSIIGSLLGALNIYLITYVLSTFSFGKVQSFVTDLAYGLALVLSLLLTLVLPKLPVSMRNISPFALFTVLGVIALGVILHAKDEIIVAQQAPAFAGFTVLGSNTEVSADSGLTILGAEADTSGLIVLGAETSHSAKPATGGTGLVVAAVIICVVLYLFYLLYRYASVPIVAFIGVIILLVLGVTLYDRPDPAMATDMSASAATAVRSVATRTVGVFQLEIPDPTSRVVGISVFKSTLAGWLLISTGAILAGSLLIILSVQRVHTRIRDVPLLLYLALAAAVVGIIVYAHDGHPPFNDRFYISGLGVLVVGAILFVVTLPSVQSRVKNISHVLFTLIAAITLASMYFAAGPADKPDLHSDQTKLTAQQISLPSTAVTASVEVQNIHFSDTFFVEVFWSILAAAAVFLAALPRVWKRFIRFISFDQGVKALSYTGLFIVGASILALGGLFAAAQVPLWKFGVGVVAALIGARFAWHFLGHYRRISHTKTTTPVHEGQQTMRPVLGVDR